jgi:hypothetical protein
VVRSPIRHDKGGGTGTGRTTEAAALSISRTDWELYTTVNHTATTISPLDTGEIQDSEIRRHGVTHPEPIQQCRFDETVRESITRSLEATVANPTQYHNEGTPVGITDRDDNIRSSNRRWRDITRPKSIS